MTNFLSYYNQNFQKDLIRFFDSIPDNSKFHEDTQNKQVFAIQHERLKPDLGHLSFLSKDEKEYFAVALFFTILVDMVCYSHFKQYYQKFNTLTRYPKFIGNCPGACNYHFHPNDIFRAMNFSRSNPISINSEDYLQYREKFKEAIPVMEYETKDFFLKYMNEINAQFFWDKCKNEFPYSYK